MIRLACFAFAIAASSACWAQETAAPDIDTTPPEMPVAMAPPDDTASTCCHIEGGTPLILEIQETLDSSLLKRGDRFRIRLAEALTMDGHTLIAAGTEGIGEVVHAERSRGGGKAGELLIAARYLDHQGSKVPLRGLKMGGAGKDKSHAALALSIAAGPFALFLQGGEIVIPAGSLAEAKVAQGMDFRPLQQDDDIALPNAVPTAAPADPGIEKAAESAIDASGTPPARDMAPPSTPELPARAVDDPPIQQP